MKNVIFYEFFSINGSFIDMLDYYVFMKSININIELNILTNVENIQDILKKIINDKYINISLNINEIVILKYNMYTQFVCNIVLIFDWGSLKNTLFKYNKLVYLYEHSVNNKISDILYNRDNVSFYNEMYFGKGIKYINKINFKNMKKIENKKNRNIGYINCLSKGTPEVIEEILKKYNFDKLIITASSDMFDNIPNVQIYKSHPKDFFTLFDTYIYYHDGIYFDPRPRLFHECIFYNKKIIYINKHNIKDGSYYRYKDAIENGWEHRNLTEDDEIIKLFKTNNLNENI